MEARTAEDLPQEDGPWQYEPKWDGFRCLAFKSGSTVDLRGKSGKPLGRFFPEVVALLKEVPAKQFVVDGELVIEIGGLFAFDALQMRLHPAESRIRKLASDTPARLILFDMLADATGEGHHGPAAQGETQGACRFHEDGESAQQARSFAGNFGYRERPKPGSRTQAGPQPTA